MPRPSHEQREARDAAPGVRAARLVERLGRQVHHAMRRRQAWLTAATLLGAGWLALLIDRLLEPSPAVRGVALAAVALATLLGLWRAWRVKPPSDRDVIAILWRRDAELANRVATARTLSADDTPAALAARRAADASAEAAGEPQLVRASSDSFARAFTLVATAAIAGLVMTRPDLASHAMRRAMLDERVWPRRVTLSLAGAVYDREADVRRRVVAIGEPARLDVEAAAESSAQLPPVVWSRGRDGATPLTRIDTIETRDALAVQRHRLSLGSVNAPSTRTLRAGDARLRVRLEPRSRPTIEELTLVSTPPSYLAGQPTELPAGVEATVPEGATLCVVGRASRALSAVEAAWRPTDGQVSTSPRTDSLPTEVLPPDEISVTLADARTPGVLRLVVTGEAGLASTPLETPVRVVADTPPDVSLALPDVGDAVTPSARVPVRVRATDDHGVASLAVIVRCGEASVRYELATDGLAAGDATSAATIDLTTAAWDNREAGPLAIGKRIEVFAEANDAYNLAPREPTRTEPITLQVVAPAELLGRIAEAQRDLGLSVRTLATDVDRLAYQLARRPDERADDPAAERWRRQRGLDAATAADASRSAAARAEALRRRIQNNRLDEAGLARLLGSEVAAPLRDRVTRPLQEIARSLSADDATRRASAEAAEKFAAVASRAAAAADEVAARLEGQQDYNTVVSTLRGLIGRQRAVVRRTTEAERAEAREALFE